MAESYTTPHSLPILGTADLVRSPSGDNLRKQLNALSVASNNAITNEGARAESAAKSYADTKDTNNRSAWAAADAVAQAEAIRQSIGPKVVALDTDGTPYYTTTGATLRVFPDTDGNPYYAEDPWPAVATDTDGVPYLTY